MSTVLQRTSTASSEVRFVRRVSLCLYAPLVRMCTFKYYRDWGTSGINNSAAKSTIINPVDLGWSLQETKETRAKLAAFEEDWLTPGMEAYDDL